MSYALNAALPLGAQDVYFTPSQSLQSSFAWGIRGGFACVSCATFAKTVLR